MPHPALLTPTFATSSLTLYSTTAMQRAMDAFRSDEPLYNIPEVIGSPRLVLQLFAALNSIALTTTPQGRDIQLLPDGTWQLRPDFVTSIWHGCGRLATFIICAAHGFDMANYTGDLPFNLPLACIRQISLPALPRLSPEPLDWSYLHHPSWCSSGR